MNWFFKSGDLAVGDWDCVVNDTIPGWQHTGLRVGSLSESSVLELPADSKERILFLLAGTGLKVEYKSSIALDFTTQMLGGRESVFHGPTDLMYLPRNTAVRLTGNGRVAVGEATAHSDKPAKYISADSVPVFIRGAGSSSRQVHNFGVPEELDASSFVVVEVIVPAGNWSGIPPHKHDTYVPGVESNLEEIYYFETAVQRGVSFPEHADPVGYLRAYSSDERPIEISQEVRSGDVALIPYGWHGPAAAQPGYDLYFFNVMAGPDPDRSWNITDDPNHAWLRETWLNQLPDPRLPYTAN